MKIIALEEHFVTTDIQKAWESLPPARQDPSTQLGAGQHTGGINREGLLDLGDQRLADMDDEGVDVQVLSVTAPGVNHLAPREAVALARSANDELADAVRRHPDRFEGLVTLPTPDPRAAVEELTRGIDELGLQGAMLNGRAGGRNIDDPAFDDLWAAAAERKAPVYIHPQLPPTAVRDAYYTGFRTALADTVFAAAAIGWHYETGVQLLRLVYSGVFDRHPDLQVILGHWGEVVLFYEERIALLDRMGLELDRTLHEYLTSNVSYTPSGMFSERYLRWAREVAGIERLMFAVDYPYVATAAADGRARAFLADAALTDAEKEQIAHANWEALTAQLRNQTSPATRH
jgi:predicted TIM-barrel fold metal-dependent hydrolase